MKYREKIYKNAIKTIENIYMESRYNSDIDLYRSLDIIHFVDENQLASKEWLVSQLIKYLPDHVHNIAILGSWYGSISFMLREKLGEEVHIQNIDSDEFCKHY